MSLPEQTLRPESELPRYKADVRLDGTKLTLPTSESYFRKRFVGRALTGEKDESDATTPWAAFVPSSKLYPHVFDPAAESGRALDLVSQAVQLGRTALEEFDVPDLEACITRLVQISAVAGQAAQQASFNRGLSASLGFIRRATLAAGAMDLNRPALNSLQQALNSLEGNPMLDLTDAAELTSRLSNCGWKGTHAAVADLIAAILSSDDDVEAETIQADLFSAAVRTDEE